MNLATIALKSIRQRMLSSSLTALSVALGVMLMVAVLVIHGIVADMFNQRSIGYDLIVGAKGSPLQLVLNTVYRVSQPIDNLPYLFYLDLEKQPLVEHAIPFCLGDVTEQGGFPLVGTTNKYFELSYAPRRTFAIKGTVFRKSLDAIIGSHVAKENGWKIGSQFTLVHGGRDSDHVHDEKFTVAGMLAPTGTANDKTVFIHLKGFFAIAGHEKPPEEAIEQLQKFYPDDPRIQQLERSDFVDEEEEADAGAHAGHHHHALPDELKEVTAVLLRMKNDVAAIMFASQLENESPAMAVNPILPMRRLMVDIVGNVQKVLLVLTGLIIVVSGVGIFVSIYNSMSDRRREIAIMRALGASRGVVFSIILVESILLCFGGGLLGVAMGHGLVFIAAPYVELQSGILIDPLAFEMAELYLLPVLIAMASLVGFVPGLTAYRTDVARALAD